MSQLFFTKAAAARFLPFATKIETLRVFKGAVQVTYRTKNGRCSTFLSKTAFYQDFTAFRQEGAQTCTVKRWGAGSYQCRYEVFSGKSEKIYSVELSAGITMCSCPDWEKQRTELGKTAVGCKHILAAVIGTLGHSSLTNYLECQQAAKARIVAEAETARLSIFAY
jgi:hypothetical protein